MSESGWLNVDKPIGYTSAKIVAIIKRFIKAKKVGHGGTLDPFASGVLPICINEATKTVEYMMDHNKIYLFYLTFGIETDTFDPEGAIINQNNIIPTAEDINNILHKFIGNIKQVPPKYSALKFNGQRACDLIRQGKDVEIEPRDVKIYSLIFNGFASENTASFTVECGRGTYIRSLGVDIANSLGAIAYISKLIRLKVGSFDINNSINLDNLDSWKEKIIPINDILDLPIIYCSFEDIKQLRNGVFVKYNQNINSDLIYKVLDNTNSVVCLAKYNDGFIKSVKVFK